MHPALAPRAWGFHLLAIVLVAIAVALGLWQYGAWQDRRTAEARDLTDAAPVAFTDVIGPDDPFPGADLGRPVELTGTWVDSGTVLISDRERDGADGYWVVTPVAVGVNAKAPAVEVVRGWIARPDDVPAAPQGPAEVVGWLQPPEGTGAVDADPNDNVLPQLRIADAIQHVDQDLYGAYVISRTPTAELASVTPEQLPEAGRFTALRNFLYAFEWWFFGLFAAFIWWRWVRDDLVAEPVTADR